MFWKPYILLRITPTQFPVLSASSYTQEGRVSNKGKEQGDDVQEGERQEDDKHTNKEQEGERQLAVMDRGTVDVG